MRRHPQRRDRKSTRLNSSHVRISYAVFCLKKKKHKRLDHRVVAVSHGVDHEPAHAVLLEHCLGDVHLADEERELGSDQFFFFNDTATTEIYTLSLHDALPI